jgi:leucyl aminopeptidase
MGNIMPKKTAPKSASKPEPKSEPKSAKAKPKTNQSSTKTASKAPRGATPRTPRSAVVAPRSASHVMGYELTSWAAGLRKVKGAEARSGRRGFVFAIANVSNAEAAKLTKKLLSGHLNRWQLASVTESQSNGQSDSQFFQGEQGPVWIIRAVPGKSEPNEINLEKTNYARFRDLSGALVGQMLPYKLEKLILEFVGLTVSEEQAIIVGLEMASYSYAENRPQMPKARKKLPQLLYKSENSALLPVDISAAANLALAVNLARHYTNLPGGDLNPKTYADSITSLFSDSSSVSVDVWADEKLHDEKMGLLLAVGGAAAEGPRFVHMKYRPANAAPDAKPIALVGKGVTFDSGGLDIKPSSGMRLMKKDMGGSAAVVALVKWAEMSQLPLPIDAYVSLAENAVGSRSFRPGDVIVARNGMTVEISNTDAEGRLVMADAICVAVENDPAALIDISTLTGAIKVGLGSEIAGLFSNSDHLASILTASGFARGDFMWRMPLFQGYRSQLKSSVADCSNCSDSGFGGAITAALFLESFVKEVPWVHLDIYAWKDSAGGAWSEGGGNGQPVQAMAEFLTHLAIENEASEMA